MTVVQMHLHSRFIRFVFLAAFSHWEFWIKPQQKTRFPFKKSKTCSQEMWLATTVLSVGILKSHNIIALSFPIPFVR